MPGENTVEMRFWGRPGGTGVTSDHSDPKTEKMTMGTQFQIQILQIRPISNFFN